MDIRAKPYISCSQATTILACQRKWWLRQGRIVGSTPSQQKGTDLHKAVAEYLESGTFPAPIDPDIKRLILEADTKGFLPTQGGSPLIIEAELSGILVDPLWGSETPYRGFVDLVYEDDGLTICDHKTHKSWRYAKESLKDDLQMCLYAYHYMEIGDEGSCRIEHIQYNTTLKKEAVRRVRNEVTKEEAFAVCEPILSEAFDLSRQLVKIKEHGKVPCNRDHCKAYGGCEFRSICAFI